MCEDGGFLTSDDVRTGYVKPIGKPWKQVQYANVDGLAIFEGCIILGETATVEADAKKLEHVQLSMPEVMTEANAGTMGVAIKGAQYRWKNRTIPFVIAPDLPEQQRVMAAITHWHQHTSIRFVPRTSQPDYVNIVRTGLGCASLVGRQGGMQQMILRDSCTTGNIIHELGHAIGLWHEQSRADRHLHVDIIRNNISPGKEFNFDQHIHDGVDLGAYDFGSIMHYPATAFSLTNAETIHPKVTLPPGVVMGQRVALSAGDIAAIELLYRDVPPPNA